MKTLILIAAIFPIIASAADSTNNVSTSKDVMLMGPYPKTNVLIKASDANAYAKVPATIIVVERQVPNFASQQPNGMEQKVAFEIWEDRIITCTFNGEVISATNSIDTGRAIIKLIPVDPRREH